MLFRMIKEMKVSCDWFGYILVISFHVVNVFSESSEKSDKDPQQSQCLFHGVIFIHYPAKSNKKIKLVR